MYLYSHSLKQLTSQHPYAEVYIGKPHVWTINVQNSSAVQEAIDEISRVDSPQPYLPYEFQCEGMLQRLNAYISNQVKISSCVLIGLVLLLPCEKLP